MKVVLLAAAVAALSTPVLAQDHSGHGAPAPQKATAPAAAEGIGVVRALDAKAATVTIAHDPIKALNWGAMTMPFRVAHPALLKGLKVGSKVRFQLKGQQIVGLTVL
jgi:Cu(I)/Ag(I) efflux system periplasmic protein CusF